MLNSFMLEHNLYYRLWPVTRFLRRVTWLLKRFFTWLLQIPPVIAYVRVCRRPDWVLELRPEWRDITWVYFLCPACICYDKPWKHDEPIKPIRDGNLPALGESGREPVHCADCGRLIVDYADVNNW